MVFEHDSREAAEGLVRESPYLRAGLYATPSWLSWRGTAPTLWLRSQTVRAPASRALAVRSISRMSASLIGWSGIRARLLGNSQN